MPDTGETPQLATRVETLIESWNAIRLALVANAAELGKQADSLRALAGERIVDRSALEDLASGLEAVADRIASSLEVIDRLTEQAQQTARMSRSDV